MAVVAFFATGLVPTLSPEPARGAERPLVDAQGTARVHVGHAPASRFSDAVPAADWKPAPTAKPTAKKAATAKSDGAHSAAKKINPGATATARPKKNPTRTVRPATYEELEPSAGEFGDAQDSLPDINEHIPRLEDTTGRDARVAQNPAYEPVPATDPDLEERRARFRAQLVRPFKQIREIRPFFDYEPDPEQAELDRCFNLCPRPGSPDCPDCDKPGPDGAPQGMLPCPECPVEIDLRETARIVGSVNDFPTRNFPHISYCWEPTNMYAYPLYFEDFCLERYGHTRHYLIQPPFSVGLFAAQLFGLPYQMTIDPIAKKRYALGWYRPGQYVPYKYYQVPWNTEAAIVEAGVITGGIFLFSPTLGP